MRLTQYLWPVVWRLALVWPLIHVVLHLVGVPHFESLWVIL